MHHNLLLLFAHMHVIRNLIFLLFFRYFLQYVDDELIGIISWKMLRLRQCTCDYDMSLNWSRNLRDGGDQKAIRQSYDGNIILTRYKWFIAGVYLDRGTDIDSHAGSRTFVKRSRLSARPSHLLSFFRDFWTARYQKSLVVRWRTYSTDEKLSIRRERIVGHQTTR